jgi:glycosyltransferase involved in cell wall biosynthesis
VLHLAPLWLPVSEDAPGGIETFLSGLLAALEKLGCRNTLIASGDSRVAAEVIAATPTHLCAQMAAGTAWEYAYYEQHQLALALQHAPAADVVHSHVGGGAYALSSVPELRQRVLHTHHNPVTADLEWFVAQHPETRFSTVSEWQARRLRDRGAKHCEVIHNGIEVSRFALAPAGRDELLFVGRMESVKGADRAVQVAVELGRPITLAGPIVDDEFFHRAVAPFLSDRIRYVGVVDHRQKRELYGQAACLLVLSRQDEGFGLVAVEAMACGTPVVALANGALPEIVEPGVTGYLAGDEADVPALVEDAARLDRGAVRARVAARFDVSAAADRYRDLYARMGAA